MSRTQIIKNILLNLNNGTIHFFIQNFENILSGCTLALIIQKLKPVPFNPILVKLSVFRLRKNYKILQSYFETTFPGYIFFVE